MAGGSNELWGRWETDPDDATSLREYGRTFLEIRRDGTLDYSIHLPDKVSTIKLEYRIDGDTLITDQPSAPKEERTRFWLTDGKLVLLFESHEATYIRSKQHLSTVPGLGNLVDLMRRGAARLWPRR